MEVTLLHFGLWKSSFYILKSPFFTSWGHVFTCGSHLFTYGSPFLYLEAALWKLHMEFALFTFASYPFLHLEVTIFYFFTFGSYLLFTFLHLEVSLFTLGNNTFSIWKLPILYLEITHFIFGNCFISFLNF